MEKINPFIQPGTVFFVCVFVFVFVHSEIVKVTTHLAVGGSPLGERSRYFVVGMYHPYVYF